MRYRVVQILTMITVFSVICFCTQKFWSSRTNLDMSTEVWIHEYLRGDQHVSLNYRQNELLPYEATISGESRLLPMVSQLESIEGLVVSYTKLNMRDFKWLDRMKNSEHFLAALELTEGIIPGYVQVSAGMCRTGNFFSDMPLLNNQYNVMHRRNFYRPVNQLTTHGQTGRNQFPADWLIE